LGLTSPLDDLPLYTRYTGTGALPVPTRLRRDPVFRQ